MYIFEDVNYIYMYVLTWNSTGISLQSSYFETNFEHVSVNPYRFFVLTMELIILPSYNYAEPRHHSRYTPLPCWYNLAPCAPWAVSSPQFHRTLDILHYRTDSYLRVSVKIKSMEFKWHLIVKYVFCFWILFYFYLFSLLQTSLVTCRQVFTFKKS